MLGHENNQVLQNLKCYVEVTTDDLVWVKPGHSAGW